MYSGLDIYNCVPLQIWQIYPREPADEILQFQWIKWGNELNRQHLCMRGRERETRIWEEIWEEKRENERERGRGNEKRNKEEPHGIQRQMHLFVLLWRHTSLIDSTTTREKRERERNQHMQKKMETKKWITKKREREDITSANSYLFSSVTVWSGG